MAETKYTLHKVNRLPAQPKPGAIYFVAEEGVAVIVESSGNLAIYGGIIDAQIYGASLTLLKSRGGLERSETITIPLVNQGGYAYRLVPQPNLDNATPMQWKIVGYTDEMKNTSRYRLVIMRKYRKGGLWSVPMFGSIRAAAGIEMPGAWPLQNTYYPIVSDKIPLVRLKAIGGTLPRSYHYCKGLAIFEYDADTDRWVRKSNIAYIETTWRTVPIGELLRKAGLAAKRYTEETAPYRAGTTSI